MPAVQTYDLNCDHSNAEPELGDLRFRKLLSDTDWFSLPLAIRRRFSKRLQDGATAIYVGRVTEMRTSRPGRLLAKLARLIGSPLPLSPDVNVPSVVTVTEDMAGGGQVWTRLYARRHTLPQVIHSSKRFAGPTGLEEHVGCGIGMALRVTATPRALVFTSAGYFVQIAGLRLTLPQFLTPGALTVTHAEIDGNRFAFTLDIVHPWFGELVHQRGEFDDHHADLSSQHPSLGISQRERGRRRSVECRSLA